MSVFVDCQMLKGGSLREQQMQEGRALVGGGGIEDNVMCHRALSYQSRALAGLSRALTGGARCWWVGVASELVGLSLGGWCMHHEMWQGHVSFGRLLDAEGRQPQGVPDAGEEGRWWVGAASALGGGGGCLRVDTVATHRWYCLPGLTRLKPLC